MRHFLLTLLTTFLVVVIGVLGPIYVDAQFGAFPFWTQFTMPLFSPFAPMAGMPLFMNPYSIYPAGHFGLPGLPMPITSPFLMAPVLRMANAPVTLSITTVDTTTAPLTAIFDLIDPAFLASGISYLTTNYPLVFDLLVTTFQLPI